MDARHAARSFGFAAAARDAGLRASVYLGGSGKLGRQLKWASDAGARWAVIYGNAEEEAGTVTVRDMTSGSRTRSRPAGSPRTSRNWPPGSPRRCGLGARSGPARLS